MIEISILLFIVFVLLSLTALGFIIFLIVDSGFFSHLYENIRGFILARTASVETILKLASISNQNRKWYFIRQHLDWNRVIKDATPEQIEDPNLLLSMPMDALIEYMKKNDDLIDRNWQFYIQSISKYLYNSDDTSLFDKYFESYQKFMEKSKILLSTKLLDNLSNSERFVELVSKNEEILGKVIEGYRDSYYAHRFFQYLFENYTISKELFMEYADITMPYFKYVNKKLNTWADLRSKGNKDIKLLKKLSD